MKVGIVGSREWNDYKTFCAHLSRYRDKLFRFDMIISGGSTGVDAMAYQYAVKQGITFVCHPPKPEDGEQAFTRRNLRIVESSEVVIAFPKINSRGTKHVISLCLRLKRPFYVVMVK